MRRIAMIGTLGILAAGCFPRTALAPGPLDAQRVQAAHTRWPDSTSESLEHGRQIFLAHCSRCHSYPDRAAFDDERWPGIVNRMARKADLSPAEGDLVLHFILADRAAVPAKTP